MVEQLAGDYPNNFAALTMHVNGDSYAIPWGQERLDTFYGLAGAAPTFVVDTRLNCQASDYRYCVEQQLGSSTDTTIELSARPAGGGSWDVAANICLENRNARQVRLYVAATLDSPPGLPPDSTHVLMQTVQESDAVLPANGCETVITRVNLDPVSMAQTEDIAIIAWVQKPFTGAPSTVYQAGIMRWPFPTDAQLVSIEIEPDDVSMAVGEHLEFTATGRDQFGGVFSFQNPTWSLGESGSGAGTFSRALETPPLSSQRPPREAVRSSAPKTAFPAPPKLRSLIHLV